MNREELWSVAEIIGKLTERYSRQIAYHEAKMVEHRAAFGVRTEADAKIIAALREEVELANGECNVLRALTVDTAKYKANSDLFYNEQKRRMDAEKERAALRAEVAALQERLRASIARGHFAQMEVAALMSQTPKHPVKVGEWVRRTTGSDSGRMAQVKSIAVLQYDVQIDGYKAFWASSNCEPCDPPEATHDTPTGKQVAESAAKTEPVADEIKVGDVVRPKVWGIGQMTKVTQVLPDGTLLIENSIKTWKVDEVVKLVQKVTT